jgi:hypothetical protein
MENLNDNLADPVDIDELKKDLDYILAECLPEALSPKDEKRLIHTWDMF